MDNTVLVSEDGALANLARGGRPKRTEFALRHYGKVYTLAIPSGLFENGDRIDFFLSSEGFAIRLTPSGERAISNNLTNIPRVIADCMASIKDGVTELSYEEYDNHTWFFPFCQFSGVSYTGQCPMKDMVLIHAKAGRQLRTSFALRHYGKIYALAIPSGICEDGDRLHFMGLPDGFMVTLTPWGEKPILKKGAGYVTTIPRAIAKRMMRANRGVTELIFEERLNRTWFFPFSQFQPLQSTSGVLPVDDPTTLMEH